MLKEMKNFCKGLKLAPNFAANPHSPIGVSERLEPLPLRGSKDLDVLGDLVNFNIVSTKTPPHWGRGRFGCLWRYRKFYHCKYQNPPPNRESEDLDIWEI